MLKFVSILNSRAIYGYVDSTAYTHVMVENGHQFEMHINGCLFDETTQNWKSVLRILIVTIIGP